jgi:hypothetical protein
MGGAASSMIVSTRKRCPSAETTYCGPELLWIAPPTRVRNNRTGVVSSAKADGEPF